MKGVDLSVEFCGLKLRNPLILTPGPMTQDGESILQAARYGAGAVINRSIEKKGGKDPMPCLSSLGGGILNATTASASSVDDWIEREFPKAKKAGIPIIGSIFVLKAKSAIAEYTELAGKVADAGAAMLHVVTNYVDMSLDEARAIIASVKKTSDLPVCVNLNYAYDIERVGGLMRKAGADAALVVDGPWAMKIDVSTGMPIIGSPDGTGHLCGRPVHPLSVYCVYKLAKAVDMPLIGSGGVYSGEDALELMMAGATAVGLQSSVITGGFEKIREIRDEMSQILEEQGVKSVKDIVGKTIRLVKGRTEKDIKYHEKGNISLSEMRKILRNP
ncbi:MAG TPA: hypothetical protein VJ574_06905 [Candidatus Bathyarchaeia archaeon]|nr:hypothetical protein [Candidatus Bathyarchaeia archaeon]